MLPALGIPVDVPFDRLDAANRSSGCVEGVPGTGFTGLKGFFQGLEQRVVQAARPGLPRPMAAVSRPARRARGLGCGPRRWPSRSRAATSPSCRR